MHREEEVDLSYSSGPLPWQQIFGPLPWQQMQHSQAPHDLDHEILKITDERDDVYITLDSSHFQSTTASPRGDPSWYKSYFA